MKQIKIYNLTGRDVEAGSQLVKAKDLFNVVGNFTRPVDTIVDDFAALKKDMKTFNDKMDDLFNHTQYALNKANEAENLYAKNE